MTDTPTPDPACDVSPATTSTQHKVLAEIDFQHRRVIAAHEVRYINRFDEPLSQLVLSVEANRWPGVFRLQQVLGGDSELAHTLEGTRLLVTLPSPLAPGCQSLVQLVFGLEVPPIAADVTAYKGYLGYSPRQMNLGHWLPTTAVRQGDEWITHAPFLIGEQELLDVADWDVTLRFVGEQIPVIAAPGIPLQVDERAWQYILRAGRDFSISLSPDFVVSRQQAENGTLVELYSFADVVTSDAHALALAASSVGLYESLFGAFPYERMVVVQGDFPDGMEHSGLVFVSGDWFARYDGNPASFLTVITVHEVAHQWWYARVGSDAALTPWLDEALATYSEILFLERTYPQLVEWWWDWRVERFAPSGFVDGTVYEFSTIREYINAVYLRGVWMLHDLRGDLGDEAFLAWLRSYVEAGDGKVATPALFWSLLTPEQLAQTQATRDQYLRQPQVPPR